MPGRPRGPTVDISISFRPSFQAGESGRTVKSYDSVWNRRWWRALEYDLPVSPKSGQGMEESLGLLTRLAAKC